MRFGQVWPYGRKGNGATYWELRAAGSWRVLIARNLRDGRRWTETKTVSRQKIEEYSRARGIGGLGLNERARRVVRQENKPSGQVHGMLLNAEAMRITSRYILSTGPTWSSPTCPVQGTGLSSSPVSWNGYRRTSMSTSTAMRIGFIRPNLGMGPSALPRAN
jgi:hypothetical protein